MLCGHQADPEDHDQGLSTPNRPGWGFWVFWLVVGAVWVVGLGFAVCGVMSVWRSL